MPRPAYILCADRVVEDKTTNLVTVVAIVEVVRVEVRHHELNAQEPRARRQGDDSAHAIAVWRGEPDDVGVNFSHEWALIVPGQPETRVPTGEFTFDPEKPLQRFRLAMNGLPQPPHSGMVEIESRLRPTGIGQWYAQRFQIAFVVVNMPRDAN